MTAVDLSGIDVDAIYSVALRLAVEAGEHMRNAYVKYQQAATVTSATTATTAAVTPVEHLKGASFIDIATDTDRECEKLIKNGIAAAFPSHRFLGEEENYEQSTVTPAGYSSSSNSYGLTNELTWCVDPIDGTTNFIHQMQHCCVSIAVLYQLTAVVAVVHAPISNETFTAIQGRGAFVTQHNQQKQPPPSLQLQHPASHAIRLHASTTVTAMHQSLVIQELGYDRSAAGVANMLRIVQQLCSDHNVRAIRMIGSCALNMCYVAAGRAQAYHEGINCQYGPKPWDSAAAALIATEAGALLCDTTGVNDSYNICNGRLLVACSKEIAEIMVAVINNKQTAATAAHAAQ